MCGPRSGWIRTFLIRSNHPDSNSDLDPDSFSSLPLNYIFCGFSRLTVAGLAELVVSNNASLQNYEKKSCAHLFALHTYRKFNGTLYEYRT